MKTQKTTQQEEASLTQFVASLKAAALAALTSASLDPSTPAPVKDALLSFSSKMQKAPETLAAFIFELFWCEKAAESDPSTPAEVVALLDSLMRQAEQEAFRQDSQVKAASSAQQRMQDASAVESIRAKVDSALDHATDAFSQAERAYSHALSMSHLASATALASQAYQRQTLYRLWDGLALAVWSVSINQTAALAATVGALKTAREQAAHTLTTERPWYGGYEGAAKAHALAEFVTLVDAIIANVPS